MRALILPAVALIETGTGGPVSDRRSVLRDVARLRKFPEPQWHSESLAHPANYHDAQAFIERYAPRAEDLPLAVCPDGSVLRNPTESVLANHRMLDSGLRADRVYDVAVGGRGPRGIATAVYAASEGVVLVIDAQLIRRPGGR